MDQTRTLLIYYSRTGTTRKLAEAIAAEFPCDVEELQDVHSRKGLFGWLRSGYEASSRKLPEIKRPEKDPAQYDLVIVGTPVWASTMASPIRTYLTRNKSKLINNVAFFCTMGGSESGHTIPDMGGFCECDALASLPVSTADVKANVYLPKVKDFAVRLRQHSAAKP